MDNDNLRRGKPTAHRVFGESAAILAGDALLTEAFGVMTAPTGRNGVPAARAMAAVRTIARAAGMDGMVGGQVADLEAEGSAASLATVRGIHRRKTGALIEAAKATYSGVLGPAATRAALDREIRRALGALEALAPRAALLEGLAVRVGAWGNAGSTGQRRDRDARINRAPRRSAGAISRSRVGR
jgi:geranylgeranyl diphosphate synthase type II